LIDANTLATDIIDSNRAKINIQGDGNAAPVLPMGRYVPPAARKLGGNAHGGSLAERMRKEREAGTVVATKVVPKTTATGARVPVGMMPVETHKKSSSSKKGTQRVNTTKVDENLSTDVKSTDIKKSENNATESTDPEKRSKKLKKLLKQIEELKEKDLLTLNDDQKQKIASEGDIRRELEHLNL